MKDLEIVIPVKNEEKNIAELTRQIDHALRSNDITYNIIYVVDKSTDKTIEEINKAIKEYPVILHEKKHRAGKGYSLVEGLELATAEYVGFIDGDLQYPPHAIPEMYKKLNYDKQIGVLVANRKTYNSQSLIRKIGSRANVFIFGNLLLGLKCDMQSGLKVFRRDIFPHLDHKLITAWTFDIPLLHAATELGYKIDQVDISFENRANGASHVGFIKTAWAIAKCAIKTKLSEKKIYHIETESNTKLIYRKKQYVTHTNLPHHKSAIYTLVRGQKLFLLFALGILVYGIATNVLETAKIFVAFLSAVYFFDVFFNTYLVLKSLHLPPEIDFDENRISELKDNELPKYTIMCPLYKEWEVLPQFVTNMEKMDWPKDKLEVLLLLEENDTKTIEVANNTQLPSYIKIVVVPHSMPKTKPKACNYGLRQATGEYVVVYDAEDQPEPYQLKKAYLAFINSKPNVFCIQAKLNYYNPSHNLLTRLFTAEYSLWFDVILPGLQSIETTIPLGGTSNHFRTENLKSIHGWDPFNVTEDCDLGVRLFKEGYKTAIIDSTTLEEANSNTKNWIRQRSRWIKGYMQTYFVHMRDPLVFLKKSGLHALIFQLIIGLRIYFMLINPILWLATISYFLLYKYTGPTIESLYPTAVFYMAAVSLVFGNFIYLYNYMIGCAKRGHWSVIKFVFLVPFYWAMMSMASIMAFYQLVFKPHHWEKTIHGLHFKKKADQELKATQKAQAASIRKEKIRKLKEWVKSGAATDWAVGLFDRKSAIKQFVKSGLAGGSVLVAASILSNFLNYVYNAYLSRRLDIDDFGLISLFGSLVFLSSIPLSALTRTMTYKSAFYLGKHNKPVYKFWRYVRSKVFVISIVTTVIWVALLPWLKNYFNSESLMPFIIFTPVLIVNALTAVDIGYLSGNLKFYVLAGLLVVESIVKLFATAVLVESGYKDYVYLAIPVSLIVSFAVGYYFALRIGNKKILDTEAAIAKFPSKFFASSFLARFAIVAYISFDIILAQHFLNPSDAGRYALISLIGKMIFFVGTLSAQFIIPVISRDEGANKDTPATFNKLLIVSALSSFGVYVIVGLLGKYTAPILLGDKIIDVVNLLPIYGFGMLCFSISSSIISYHQVKDRHIYSAVSFVLAIAQIVAFWANHKSLHGVIDMMASIGIINLIITLVMHKFWNYFVTVETNIYDFFGAFLRLPQKTTIDPNSLNVLIFNWRDNKHLWAGGAEVYIHELAKKLIKEGHKVTVFCGNDHKCPRYEEIDEVQIVRRGGFYTVYIWAFIYYIIQFRGKYDVVIDSENGIPFFTPLYVRKPIIGLIHHVHQEVILTELKLSLSQIPVAYVAKLLEAKLMPIVYANVKMITVSESSKRDMEKIGLGKRHVIDIVNPGIEPSRFYTAPKSKYPTILYVGRLKAYKRLDTLIRAMKHITKDHPKAKLIIAGFGESRSYLEKLVKNMGIEDSVEFLGKIDDDTRSKLLAEAWVFAYPSSMEGWGISIIEANASGTAVVASDVPGLMDSVNNYETGYLVKMGDEVDFAEKISMLIKDHKQRKYMEDNALLWAKKHTWELSAKKLISHMHALVNDAHEYADATSEVLAEEETTYGRH